MKITRREFALMSSAAALGAAGAGRLSAEGAGGLIRAHGSSLIGDLKYPADFRHFDYVNPDAPKGGVARLGTQGGFDSFNPFIVKGDPPTGIGLIFESLMDASLDRGSEQYGLLAEWFEHPADYSHASFKIRDEARWHDGRPVTAADVVFSFTTLVEKGHPQYRFYYANVTEARDMGDGVVRFDFDQAGNRELPQIMGQLTVLPQHWWSQREFDRTSLERPLGSGPYRVGDFETGRFIEYERVEDYWGADLPVRRGTNNFDRLRWETFLDAEASFEGFKSGVYDFRNENSALRWTQGYDFPAVKRGEVRREQLAEDGPKTVQAFAFNLRRRKFQDRRVREAISLAFDFEYTNRIVYFGLYARPQSYFQGSEGLMQTGGAPEGRELELLEELRGQVPEEVFGPAWSAQKTDGSGRDRRALRKAAQLLKEAGYTLSDGQLMTPEGEPFALEFLSAQDSQARVIQPFLNNLKTLGVTAEMRIVDGPQYIRRVAQDDSFDWDMIISGVANSESPGNEQREFWGSETAMRVGARNYGGVADPAVDALINKIIFAENRGALEAASRALDRVLLWNHYMVPQLYTPTEQLAWWDKFGHPEPLPPRSHGFPAVWWSKET